MVTGDSPVGSGCDIHLTEELLMTEEMMTLRAQIEKSPDGDRLREMIGFAVQRLMELEVEGLTGAAYGEKNAACNVMATAIAIGRRATALSSCASRSCARAPNSRASWSRAAWPRGAHRRGAGGLCARRVDPLGGRSGTGDG